MQCYIGVWGRNVCRNIYCSKLSWICHPRLILSASCKNLSSSSSFCFSSLFPKPTRPQRRSPTTSKAQTNGAAMAPTPLCSASPATHTSCLLLSEVYGPQHQNQTITLQELFTQPLPPLHFPVTWEKVGKWNPRW